MKKTICALTLVLTIGIGNTHAQVLDVIKLVSEVLIPSISGGVKDVISTSGNVKDKNKDALKKELEDKIKSTEKSAKQEVIKAFDTEAANIEGIRQLFNKTRTYASICSNLSTLSNRQLLKYLVDNNSSDIRAIIITKYDENIKKLKESDFDKSINTVKDKNLYDDIEAQREIMFSSIRDVNVLFSQTKNDILISQDKYITYLTAMENASTHVTSMITAINEINRKLDNRFKQYKEDIEDAKKSIN